MDFGWTEDHLALRRGAAEFGARRLAEGAGARDREGCGAGFALGLLRHLGRRILPKL